MHFLTACTLEKEKVAKDSAFFHNLKHADLYVWTSQNSLWNYKMGRRECTLSVTYFYGAG